MMAVRIEKFSIATDGSGDWTETRRVPSGRLLQYRLVYVDTDTGADLDITGSATGVVYVNQDNIGTSSFTRLPRFATSDETGAASLFAAAGEPVEDALVIGNESIVVTIAQGGASKTGTLYLWIQEL